jgi:hypothetical protein
MIIRVQDTIMNLIDEGTYEAKLDSINPISTVNGDAYKLVFTITEDDLYKDRKVNGVCGTMLYRDSKLYKWLSAIRCKELAPDEEVDLDQLIGTTCQIVVGHAERNGRTYANVIDITLSDDSDAPF